MGSKPGDLPDPPRKSFMRGGISFGGNAYAGAAAGFRYPPIRNIRRVFMFGKRGKILVATALALLIVAVAFVGCDGLKELGKPVIETGDKSVTVIIADDAYPVKTGSNYVHDLLVELKEAGEIEYEFHDTQYGAFIDKLGELVGTEDYSKWIAIYVDSDDAELITPGFDVTVDGKTYHSASLGASGLPVKNGVTYLFLQQ